MGIFSFMYSDRDSKNPENNIKYHGSFMMKLPEFVGGKHIVNRFYEGYGTVGETKDYDIFEIFELYNIISFGENADLFNDALEEFKKSNNFDTVMNDFKEDYRNYEEDFEDLLGDGDENSEDYIKHVFFVNVFLSNMKESGKYGDIRKKGIDSFFAFHELDKNEREEEGIIPLILTHLDCDKKFEDEDLVHAENDPSQGSFFDVITK